MAAEQNKNNNLNKNSNSSHFTDTIENLRSEAQLSAGKKIFNVCQFKLSS